MYAKAASSETNDSLEEFFMVEELLYGISTNKRIYLLLKISNSILDTSAVVINWDIL